MSNEKKTTEQEENEKVGKMSGLAGGVISGAAIGSSIMPVVGTFAGAVVGGVVGSEVGKKVGGKILDTLGKKDRSQSETAGKADVTAELERLGASRHRAYVVTATRLVGSSWEVAVAPL